MSISPEKESELVKAIEDRIEHQSLSHGSSSAYAQIVGFFEGYLPGLLTEEQADVLIARLAQKPRKVVKYETFELLNQRSIIDFASKT